MVKLKRNLLSVALVSAMTLSATSAFAQTAAETADKTAQPSADEAVDLDRVTVTGIRRGIENAIETKRESTSIVETISAEDIGKLPDISIAESLARLPGLTAQRVAGRATNINIRGLPDSFGTTLLNGREQVSTGDNRGVEFDQYPSELIGAVVVHKTTSASLIGQGLSGTVDLQTVRPLAFGERVVSVNVRGEHNSLGPVNPGMTAYGSRISASYVDQFMDGRLGVALGFARLDSPGQSNRWESWGYPTGTVNGQDDIFLPGGTKSIASSTENVRNGYMAVVEFKPNDNWSSVLDLYYSKFEREETSRFIEVGLGWGGFDNGSGYAGAQLSNAVVQNGVVVSGTYSGVKPVVRNDLNTRSDDITAFGWNNKFNLGEAWVLDTDISYSKADRKEMILETYSGTSRLGATGDTVDFVIDPSTGLTNLSFGVDYTDPSLIVLNDSAGWGQDGYVKYPHVTDELTSGRISLERSFETGMFSSLEFGVNHSDREKTRSVPESFVNLTNGPTTVVEADLLNRPTRLSFGGIPGSLSYDILGAVARYYTLTPKVHGDIYDKQWSVREKATTGYTQLNINTDWGPVSVRGNVGLQAVRTDQSSVGYAIGPAGLEEADAIERGTTYTDYLPSLNLAFGFSHDQTLRFGAGRQMARPRMDEMRASRNYSVNLTAGNVWQGNGGNPELKPWIANSYDLSYEKYFGGKGYISLAAFYKDLRTYIYSQDILDYDFGDMDPGQSPQPESNIGTYSTLANGEGGTMSGYEVAVSVPLDLIWEPLLGFGVVANYSNVDSSISPRGPGNPDEPIPGLSKEVTNLTVYYENKGFSTRLSQRKRSPFLGEVTAYAGQRDFRYIDEETLLDFQIGYQFQEPALQGLSVLLQVNNVTNERYREFYQGTGLTRMYNEYGRQVMFGVTYKF